MALSLAQNIKQQIVTQLQALKTSGILQTVKFQDTQTNPIDLLANNPLPLAYVAMPRIDSAFEDNKNNIRTYRFDILVALDPNSSNTDPEIGLEGVMDQVLNTLDTAFALSGAAVAGMLPTTISGLPVSTSDKTYQLFTVTIMARTLYTLGT